MTTAVAQKLDISFGPNLHICLRAQTAKASYRVQVELDGRYKEMESAPHREAAESAAATMLEECGLSDEAISTLVALLDLDAQAQILKGPDHPSSTIHAYAG